MLRAEAARMLRYAVRVGSPTALPRTWRIADCRRPCRARLHGPVLARHQGRNLLLMSASMKAEEKRLHEAGQRVAHWKRWGPYLSERAWGTVREDYSEQGTAWEYFPHDHARSRAYRWNEDGLAGICDRHQRICFALALHNGVDPILKERLFGLTGNEGNHGEDVKE